jgi:hypothetical protein
MGVLQNVNLYVKRYCFSGSFSRVSFSNKDKEAFLCLAAGFIDNSYPC